jgi:hypothetical protein
MISVTSLVNRVNATARQVAGAPRAKRSRKAKALKRQVNLTLSAIAATMSCMTTPDVARTHPTLLSAAARFDELSMRDALASVTDDEAAGSGDPLTKEEALELLALSEVIARKAAYGRQLTVRSARAAGASWSQIGIALGISKQAAWEAHSQWIEDQAERHRRDGCGGMDADMAGVARTLAGRPGADHER